MNYTKKTAISNPSGNADGVIGESALWDGPLSQVGRPHGKGSSSGANGMQVLKYPTPYEAKPITQCAKGRSNEAY
jgi:hypothetical protein|tara:strand:- start:267 stop:491 length:225 start_codon:yes stop_codon:yes gene_type:complete